MHQPGITRFSVGATVTGHLREPEPAQALTTTTAVLARTGAFPRSDSRVLSLLKWDFEYRGARAAHGVEQALQIGRLRGTTRGEP